MPVVLPQARPGAITAIGVDAANSRGTRITASGSANTKGSWAQLVASTAADARSMTIIANPVSGGQRHLLDIGIGGAGSEVVKVPDLHFGGNNAVLAVWTVPVFIPAGTRIAARLAAGPSTSRQADVLVLLDSGLVVPFPAPSQLDTYGESAADSGLTSVDPGGTANTKGGWAELASATAFAATWLMIQVGNDITNITATTSWLLDIGVGGAGSEAVLIPDVFLGTTSIPDKPMPHQAIAFPVRIAAGARIAARCQCSVNTATERLLDLAVTIAG